MDVFGENWTDHYKKIKADWLAKVAPEDTVVIPGDISWAMSFEAAKVDLDWIEALPGRKILFKGNHDYWWTSKRKMADRYQTLTFVHNDFAAYEDYAICGTRGWLCPNEVQFTPDDARIYRREGIRLENSILMAKSAGYTRFLGVLHYPPTNERKEPSVFTDTFEKFGIASVIYGHVHSEQNYRYALNGNFGGVTYRLTSCDYLDFKLFKWL
jgi:hypothetical protein